MKLPILLGQNNKLWMGLLGGVLFLLGYSIPNHFHLFKPELLPLGEFERSIPLVPWTIFIYITDYALYGIAFLLLKKEENQNKYLWAFIGIVFFTAPTFTFFPTTYPRADYPLPDNLHWATYYTFTWLRAIDDPSNTFPSLHVYCCYAGAFAFLSKGESRKIFWAFLVWATAVAISTLTTKQHYFVDIVGGLLLAMFGYWLFFLKMRYVPASQFLQRFAKETR